MTQRLIVESPAFAPAPIERRIDLARMAAAAARRQALARLASAPAVTLLVFGAIAAVAYWIPELGLRILMPAVLAQLAPAVATPVFTGGEAVAPGAPAAEPWATIAFVAALALGLASRQGGLVRHAVAPAAIVLALASIPVTFAALANPLAHLFALGAALASVTIGAVVAVIAVRATLRRGPHPFARRTPGLGDWRGWWLMAYLLALPLPFVVGRAIVGGPWRDRAAEIAASGSSAFFAPLFSWALPLSWLLGAAIGVAVWAALRLVPPIADVSPASATLPVGPPRLPTFVPATGTTTRRPRLAVPSIAALVLLGISLGVVAPVAAGEAAKTVATTRTEVPFRSDASCPVFTLPGSQPPRALVPGTRCVGIESYAGYERTGVAPVSNDLGAAEGGVTTDGDPITGRVAAGVYDPVLVIAGSTTGDELDVVNAYSFDDASVVWWFACPDGGPLSIRLAGTGADDPAAARVTHAGEGEAVYIGCLDGGVRRLDPRTGAAS